MNGGSGLNLMYLNMFEGLGLTPDHLHSNPHQFGTVFPGKQSVPLGWVTLSVTFEDTSNYRTEMLAFEVVNFSYTYHIILGRLCYVKFMAIPSYAYLKLKIPGLVGIITVEAQTQRALDCEQSSIELATAPVAMAELRELNLRLPVAPLNPGMPSTFCAFKEDEDAKAMQINTENPVKTVQIGASLDPK
jgi:hypothetical protein